jgi:hypothetical protein
VEGCALQRELVAEACGDGDLMTALGAAAVENSGSGFGGHANEEAVDFAATTAVGLEGALGHGIFPVSDLRGADLDLDYVCWPGSHERVADGSGEGLGVAIMANSTASLEYIRLEENRQRNSVCGGRCEVTHPVTGGCSWILHNGWCNSKKDSVLVNFARWRGAVVMLVSIPFRDV